MSRAGLLFVTDHVQRQEAMEWLLRLEGDDVDESVVDEWSRWYRAAAGNKTAFDALQEFSEQCEGLIEDPKRAARLKAMAFPRRAADHAISRVTRWVREHRPRPPLFAIGALSAACLMAVILALPRWVEQGPDNKLPPAQKSIVQAPIAREMLLPDGSKVELAPKSSVEVAYSDELRTLQLSSGEGYFSVAPNKTRPFVVKVGGLNVRAVGTEFNIRRAEERTIVTVTKGTVDVYPGAAKQSSAGPVAGGVRVTEGNEVTWSGNTPMVASVDTRHAATWRQGRLEYLQEPLSSVVADINRYSARQIVIRDKDVGQMSYTGTVLTDDTDEWVRSLPGVFPVTVARDDTRDYLDASHGTRPATR